jgi:hypothetical protein
VVERDISAMPYSKRRLIVITDSIPVTPAIESSKANRFWEIARSVIAPAPAVTDLAVDLIRAQMKMRNGGADLLEISTDEAEAQLRFPVGHPRKNVVYIGHPVDPSMYIPAADFHRFLFEHKMAEVQRLIRCLGAATISVIHVEGWNRESGINVRAKVPTEISGVPVDGELSVGRNVSKNETVLATMQLTPSAPPYVPEGLVWFSHEPLWQEVASARVESELDAFAIDIRSTDDYGVNASLKTLIARSHLELGGSYIEHRDTVWRLEGTFAAK